MPSSTLSRLLPYLLLAFIGLAGWSMESTALLAVVVVGTVGVSIGSSLAVKNQAMTAPKNQRSGD